VTTDLPDLTLRRSVSSSFEEALAAYEADLAQMAGAGFVPIAQVWGWDTERSPGWLVGGSSWRPGPGTLAVTFRRERVEETS
jgi:hypothetical protein